MPWRARGDLRHAFVDRVPLLGGFTAEERLLFDRPKPPSLDDGDALEALAAFGAEHSLLWAHSATSTRPCRATPWCARCVSLSLFIDPMLQWLDTARSTGLDVWGYEFGWRSSAFGGAPGAHHVLDIPFVLDNRHVTCPAGDR